VESEIFRTEEEELQWEVVTGYIPTVRTGGGLWNRQEINGEIIPYKLLQRNHYYSFGEQGRKVVTTQLFYWEN
jgi:hypothetical protein